MPTQFKANAGVCAVHNCDNSRSNVSSYCPKHANHNSRWGDPVRRCFSAKKGEGVLKIDWCTRYIEDRLASDEDLAIAVDFLQCYFSEKASKAGKLQNFAKRVHQQTTIEGYSRILGMMSAYLAEHIALPNTLPNNRMLSCAIGMGALFITTTPTSSSKKGGKVKSASYYAPRWVVDQVAKDLMANVLTAANKVATRSVKLSPFYERKKL